MKSEQVTLGFSSAALPGQVETLAQEVEQLRVLLIEDSESDADLMMTYLGEAETAYDLSWAPTLEKGKHHLQTQHHNAVLLDLNLPDSTGLATFASLHAEHPSVPIIILTGLDDRALAAEAVRAGAQDFLPKSQADGAVLDRAIRYAQERAQRQTAERQLQQVHDELAAARRIQQLLFPRGRQDVAGFDIAGDCRPTAATAGDFFDIFPITAGRLGLVVADVSSHGFGPALIMTQTRILVRTLARAHADPAEVFTIINDALMEDSPADVFVTLFLAILDIRTRTLLYGGAGHEAYVLKHTGEVARLVSTSLPLGAVGEAEFSHMKFDELSPGEVLVLLTDGFQEAASANGELFGIESTLAVVRQARNKSAQEIIDILFDAVFRHCEPSVPKDDLTALVVKVND